MTVALSLAAEVVLPVVCEEAWVVEDEAELEPDLVELEEPPLYQSTLVSSLV